MKNKSEIPPTEKQINYCMDILKVLGECESDEDGQPLFELSMENADKFIKTNRHVLSSSSIGYSKHETRGSAGDWGIPNH